jgi:transcriptional regulator with XRE-family HTH domain
VLSPEQLDALRLAPATGKNKLALAMTLAGVTQMQIADATGLTQGYISKVKTGNYHDIRGESMRALAGFFGCLMEDLFPAREAVA